MEDQIKQIIPFLSNPKLEVQSQAVEILQGLSADPAHHQALLNCNVIKELAKMLHEDKVSHQANITL